MSDILPINKVSPLVVQVHPWFFLTTLMME